MKHCFLGVFPEGAQTRKHLSFIDLERGGFGEILHEVIITEGNISPNSPSGGSINDILYRKLKASKLRIKNLTHTFVNTMFYFRINASIVAFLSNHISFGILMTKPQVLGLKKPQVLGLKLKYSSLINTIYVLFMFCRPSCCHACCPAWSTRIMFHPMFPGRGGWTAGRKASWVLSA